MKKKETLLLAGLVLGTAYGVYRFATWEINNAMEEIIRNICIPWALTLLAIRGILTMPDEIKK